MIRMIRMIRIESANITNIYSIYSNDSNDSNDSNRSYLFKYDRLYSNHSNICRSNMSLFEFIRLIESFESLDYSNAFD